MPAFIEGHCSELYRNHPPATDLIAADCPCFTTLDGGSIATEVFAGNTGKPKGAHCILPV
jgi:hypothetical protein